MKKLTSLFLALILVLSLAACSEVVKPNGNNETKPSQNESDNTEGKKSDDTDNTSENESSQDEKQKDDEKTNKNEITFTEVIAVDNAECSIKITKIDPDNIWGFTLKAQVENKSTEKTYMFSLDGASINGVECSPLFVEEVAPGKKSNEDILFSDNSLKENGIGDFTDIELSFRVYDSNDWMADPVAKETVHIYPYGEDKATKYVREAQSSDNVIVDNEYVTAIVTGYENDAIWGYTVNLFLINKTDKTVMFTVDDVSVNGFMADPFFSCSVSAGKCAFDTMSWLNSSFEENDITEVEEIEFVFRVYDSDNWFGDDFVNQTITLNP